MHFQTRESITRYLFLNLSRVLTDDSKTVKDVVKKASTKGMNDVNKLWKGMYYLH